MRCLFGCCCCLKKKKAIKTLKFGFKKKKQPNTMCQIISSPQIENLMFIIFKYLASYGILCKFNVHQQPRSRWQTCIYHTCFPGNLIQPLLTVVAPGPLTSSETTSLELSFPLFFFTPALKLHLRPNPHSHSPHLNPSRIISSENLLSPLPNTRQTSAT